MAEGGLLPWRVQRPDGMVYATYEDLFKPLPVPPPGKMWKKVRVGPDDSEAKDGVLTKWELVDKKAGRGDGGEQGEGTDKENNRNKEDEERDDGEAAFIQHVVLPTDTMAGLRLRYRVTAAELRKHNDFFGERFQCCEVLRIPIQGREPHVVKHRQMPTTPEVLRQKFKIATKCTDEQQITYYLEFNEFDLSRAVAEFEEDKEWEEKHRARMRGARVPKARPCTVVSPSNAYVPPPPVLPPPGPAPPSYRSLFSINGAIIGTSGGRKGGISIVKGSSKSKHTGGPMELSDVVSGDKSSPSKGRWGVGSKGTAGQEVVALVEVEEEEPLLAVVVAGEEQQYDFRQHRPPTALV